MGKGGAHRPGRSRRRQAALFAAGAALHAILLGLLSQQGPGFGDRPRSYDEPVVYLDIEPRTLRPSERPRTAARAEPGRAPAAVRRPRDLDEEDAEVVAPLPASLQPAAGPQIPPGASAQTLADPWSSPDAGLGAGPRRRPGALACRARGLLSPEDQARCDDAFGQAAGTAPPRSGTGDGRRDARLAQEGALALARYEAQRRPLAGGAGVMGPADCVGSTLGTGCAGAHLRPSLRQGATTNILQDSNKLD